MADTKISALPAASSFLLADELPVNEAGTSKKVTGTQMAAAILSSDNLNKGNTARQSQVVVSGTAYYITNSNLALPNPMKTGLIVGSKIILLA